MHRISAFPSILFSRLSRKFPAWAIVILLVGFTLSSCSSLSDKRRGEGGHHEGIYSEQRDGYRVEFVRIPVSGNDTAEAYWLLPDAIPEAGCTAILLCHDHGAWFTIGKEKMCRPLWRPDCDSLRNTALLGESAWWVEKCYDGMYLADSLAHAGYAVLVPDALYWGSRSMSGMGLPLDSLKRLNKQLKSQQPDFYASHLQKFGHAWFETILEDDQACVEWLLSRPEVRPESVGVAGFSMGAYRAWQLSARDSRLAFCVAAHWLTTLAANGGPLPNASSWSMYLPVLEEKDYPEIVAESTMPLLLLYGQYDHLFDTTAVASACERIRLQKGNDLTVVPMPTDHVFTKAHLQTMLQWLDQL